MSKLITEEHIEVAIQETKYAIKYAERYISTGKLDLIRLEKLLSESNAAFDAYNLQLARIKAAHLDKDLKIENFNDFVSKQNDFKSEVNESLSKLHEKRRILELAEAAEGTTKPTPSPSRPSGPKVKYPPLQLITYGGDKTKWDSW